MHIETAIGRLKLAHGFNIYVDVTAACNARCPFCIAPVVGRRDGPGFFAGLDYALDLAAQTDGTLQIVGGEPTISKRLLPILERLTAFRLRRVVLNTNAARLPAETVAALRAARAWHVNISRHHYDEQRNQAIMLQKPMVSNAELTEKIARLIDAKIRVRLQCNLIPGEIESLGDVLAYMEWGQSMGVREYSFSQIFPLGLFDYQVAPVAGWTEQAQVDLAGLVTAIDAHPALRPAPGPADTTGHGGDSTNSWGRRSPGPDGIVAHRRFWTYGESSLSLKTLAGYDEAGQPLPTAYDKAADGELRPELLAFAVVHSDGLVTASWDKRERILFFPETETNIIHLDAPAHSMQY